MSEHVPFIWRENCRNESASPEKVLVRARTRIMSFCYRIERLIVVLSPMVPLHSGTEAMAFVFLARTA